MRRIPRIGWAAAVVVLSGTAVVGADAPQGGTAARFDVASVKPSAPSAPGPLGTIPRILPPVGGRFSAVNIPLRLLVRAAYGVQDFQIVGGPSWQMSERFDIQATMEPGAGGLESVQPALKALLAERFKLKVHTETRDMPIYALVVARSDGRLGPKLKRSATTDCSEAQAEARMLAEAFAKGGPAALAGMMPKPGEMRRCSVAPAIGPQGMTLRADAQPMSTLIQLLVQATGRHVVDRTGLNGFYDWELTFDPQVLLGAAAQAGIRLPVSGAAVPTFDSPALLTSLEEQLGLKLESGRGPVDVLVIDSAERPDPD